MPLNDFRQLANLSFMVEHYQLHVKEAKAEGLDFDLTDFIYLHYISPDSHTHDIPVDHEDLPLKHINSSFHFANPDSGQLAIVLPGYFIKKAYSFIDLKGRLLGSHVFHPPSLQ